MSNAVSFNLLKFVERRPALSANKIFLIIVLCTLALLGYFLFQVNQSHTDADNSAKVALAIKQSAQTLQPMLQQGEGNPLVGVLSANLSQGEYKFYPEFEALSHIDVKGLWLSDVVIKRNPPFIKITGAMDSPDKLDQLLKQLALQPAFKNIQFIGVSVSKGLLPDVPPQAQAEVKQLKIPAFFHFIIQTTVITQQGAH